jgi:transcriptional regulator with XRE-family HTH domain
MNQRVTKRRQKFLVGIKIRELRKARSLTQAELAGKIGIQQSDLCRMEIGEYKVSLDTLFRILGIFGMNIGEFFQDAMQSPEGAEEEVVQLFRRLDEHGREEVLDFLRFKFHQSPGE